MMHCVELIAHSLQFDLQIKRLKRSKRFKFMEYIRSKSKQVNENHFSFCTPCISAAIRKISEIPHSQNLCLLQRNILVKKQHFRIFENSNIRKGSKQVNKNNFLT